MSRTVRILEAATLEAATLEAATLEAATLEAATLEAATLEAATLEAAEATAWYENEQVGLGVRFQEALDAALDLIEEDIVPLTPVPAKPAGRGSDDWFSADFLSASLCIPTMTGSWSLRLLTTPGDLATGEAVFAHNVSDEPLGKAERSGALPSRFRSCCVRPAWA